MKQKVQCMVLILNKKQKQQKKFLQKELNLCVNIYNKISKKMIAKKLLSFSIFKKY